MDKKGAELTMNYLVVIIIGLLVLVVVALIFRGQIIEFVNSIRSVTSGLGSQLQGATEKLTP